MGTTSNNNIMSHATPITSTVVQSNVDPRKRRNYTLKNINSLHHLNRMDLVSNSYVGSSAASGPNTSHSYQQQTQPMNTSPQISRLNLPKGPSSLNKNPTSTVTPSPTPTPQQLVMKLFDPRLYADLPSYIYDDSMNHLLNNIPNSKKHIRFVKFTEIFNITDPQLLNQSRLRHGAGRARIYSTLLYYDDIIIGFGCGNLPSEARNNAAFNAIHYSMVFDPNVYDLRWVSLPFGGDNRTGAEIGEGVISVFDRIMKGLTSRSLNLKFAELDIEKRFWGVKTLENQSTRAAMGTGVGDTLFLDAGCFLKSEELRQRREAQRLGKRQDTQVFYPENRVKRSSNGGLQDELHDKTYDLGSDVYYPTSNAPFRSAPESTVASTNYSSSSMNTGCEQISGSRTNTASTEEEPTQPEYEVFQFEATQENFGYEQEHNNDIDIDDPVYEPPYQSNEPLSHRQYEDQSTTYQHAQYVPMVETQTEHQLQPQLEFQQQAFENQDVHLDPNMSHSAHQYGYEQVKLGNGPAPASDGKKADQKISPPQQFNMTPELMEQPPPEFAIDSVINSDSSSTISEQMKNQLSHIPSYLLNSNGDIALKACNSIKQGMTALIIGNITLSRQRSGPAEERCDNIEKLCQLAIIGRLLNISAADCQKLRTELGKKQKDVKRRIRYFQVRIEPNHLLNVFILEESQPPNEEDFKPIGISAIYNPINRTFDSLGVTENHVFNLPPAISELGTSRLFYFTEKYRCVIGDRRTLTELLDLTINGLLKHSQFQKVMPKKGQSIAKIQPKLLSSKHQSFFPVPVHVPAGASIAESKSQQNDKKLLLKQYKVETLPTPEIFQTFETSNLTSSLLDIITTPENRKQKGNSDQLREKIASNANLLSDGSLMDKLIFLAAFERCQGISTQILHDIYDKYSSTGDANNCKFIEFQIKDTYNFEIYFSTGSFPSCSSSHDVISGITLQIRRKDLVESQTSKKMKKWIGRAYRNAEAFKELIASGYSLKNSAVEPISLERQLAIVVDAVLEGMVPEVYSGVSLDRVLTKMVSKGEVLYKYY
ncbi:hypothetical protein WICPIJ_007404 [Wickerhamomyces pijperi]|uniref:Uncharacterized protein n=1 Tax=Wickerhamomyces pijperi TaxID=599730 RepID=A0A9P8TK01_WICPI|nr:hypothetical protein WICPIJ_007404 [Wickerhamomyces pijperi]